MSCNTGNCQQPTYMQQVPSCPNCEVCHMPTIPDCCCNVETCYMSHPETCCYDDCACGPVCCGDSILDNFQQSLCCDPHKAGYLSIATITVVMSCISLGLGAWWSSVGEGVLGVWWASIPIIVGGVIGMASALTGKLVECSGNIWVLVTAILSGIGAVIGVVAISVLGVLYTLFGSYNVGGVVASEIFLLVATALSLGLHIYSVFLLGLGCQQAIPEQKCDQQNGIQMSGGMGMGGNVQTIQF